MTFGALRLDREQTRQIEVAALFAEFDPQSALEDACYVRHQYRCADQRERYKFARNGNVRERACIKVTIGGETLSLSAWCKRLGVKHRLAYDRIVQGWPPEKALTTPVRARLRVEARVVTIDGEKRTFAAWAAHFGISKSIAIGRLERGLPPLEALTTPVITYQREWRARVRGVRYCELCGARFRLTNEQLGNRKRFCSRRCSGTYSRPRSSELVLIDGDRRTRREWADRLGLSLVTVRRRIQLGMSEVEALTTPKAQGRRRP